MVAALLAVGILFGMLSTPGHQMFHDEIAFDKQHRFSCYPLRGSGARKAKSHAVDDQLSQLDLTETQIRCQTIMGPTPRDAVTSATIAELGERVDDIARRAKSHAPDRGYQIFVHWNDESVKAKLKMALSVALVNQGLDVYEPPHEPRYIPKIGMACQRAAIDPLIIVARSNIPYYPEALICDNDHWRELL